MHDPSEKNKAASYLSARHKLIILLHKHEKGSVNFLII